MVDGNAMFLSATDVVRRNSFIRDQSATIVVGISYPISDAVYSSRRGFDLTPPCENYVPPKDQNGKAFPSPHGGADILLGFINQVHRFLFNAIFRKVSVRQTALFGHSFGALFALHALFTAPTSFDAYLAASPSIWWSDGFIKEEENAFYQSPDVHHHPHVWMCYGSIERTLEQRKDESDDDFAKRKLNAAERSMADNCDDMYARLKTSKRVGSMKKRVYEDEDHGSVIATSLSGSILFFLDNAQSSDDNCAEAEP